MICQRLFKSFFRPSLQQKRFYKILPAQPMTMALQTAISQVKNGTQEDGSFVTYANGVVTVKKLPIQCKSSHLRHATRITASKQPKITRKMMDSWPGVTAQRKNVPGSRHRLMQVLDFVRGCSARQALLDLRFLNRRHAKVVASAIKEAMFRAENKAGLNADRLIIKYIFASKARNGPPRFRWRGRAYKHRRANYRSRFWVSLVEAPYMENEVRLGRKGWKNATWERYYMKQAEKQRQRQEAKAAAEEEKKLLEASSVATSTEVETNTNITESMSANDNASNESSFAAGAAIVNPTNTTKTAAAASSLSSSVDQNNQQQKAVKVNDDEDTKKNTRK